MTMTTPAGGLNSPPPAPQSLGQPVALFLDFDGTLIPLAHHPDAVSVPDDLGARLGRLHLAQGGAMALITGRALHNLARHLPHDAWHVAGQHGAEWRWAPGHSQPPGRISHDAALHQEWLAMAQAAKAKFPGLYIEDKHLSLGLHFRGAPEAEAELRAMIERMRDRSGPDYEILGGKLVVELKHKQASKGAALRRFMADAPFQGRIPVMIGDEQSDETAFAAARALGGFGVRVADPNATAQETLARYHLPDAAAVHAWLDQFLSPDGARR